MHPRARRIRQSIEYAGVRLALALAGALPAPIASAVGATLGVVAFDLVRIRRRVSVGNVARALGVTPARATHIARAAYRNMGRSLMEFSAFGRLDPAALLARVRFEGLEHLERARREGKGALLLTGHLGNWELLGASIAASGFPLSYLVGQQTNPRVDDVMNNLRRAHGSGIITRTMALRKVLQTLAAGEFIAMLTDQDARKNGVMVEFLGRPASTVKGPALFAIRRGCPVIPIFIYRAGGYQHAVIEPAIFADPSLDEEAAVRDLTRRYTGRLSAQIRAHPDQYFWPHRRWKTQSI